MINKNYHKDNSVVTSALVWLMLVIKYVHFIIKNPVFVQVYLNNKPSL